MDKMARGGEDKGAYSLVNVGTLTLENATEDPDYPAIVVCQDKISVIDYDACNVRLHRLQDGKLLATSHKLESWPRDLCLINPMEICVIHGDGRIQMMSIDTIDMSCVLRTTRTIHVQRVLDEYHSIVGFKDNLLISGVRQNKIYWCIVSPYDRDVSKIYHICEGYNSSMTTKENMIYISCRAKSPDGGDEMSDTGIYGFEISNPSQCKYTYKHQDLKIPTDITVNEDGYIFACDYGFPCSIHQLSASCKLVSIFTQGIPRNLRAIFWEHGYRRFFVACLWTHDIAQFTLEYNVSHKAPEVLMSEERKQPIIEETKTEIGQGNQIKRSVEETLNKSGIPLTTEEKDFFIKFQQEIGTTLNFSKGTQTLIDVQKSLHATEMFIEQSRPDMKDEWLEYKNQGRLTSKLIDVIYAKERNPELHDKKDGIMAQMKQLNIIGKARTFDEKGVKEEDYFLAPCMLQEESPIEVISPKQDPRIVSTSVLCFVLTESSMLPRIFSELLAAVVGHWPVAKKTGTSENLMFCNCAVYDIDLFHRLILHYRNNVVFARITRMVSDEVENPAPKLWIRVRKFITQNLGNIISRLDPNLKYELCVQSQESHDVSEDIILHFSPPFQEWFLDQEHDPDSPITREHMNHARLNVALVTICGKAMREILLANFDTQYKDIYQAILNKKGNLIPARGKQLLNQHQIQLVYPDPKGQKTGTVDQFDLSLLYTLIRNVSTVPEPTTRWGNDPCDNPRDKSLGASVERIRSYRNSISGHSPDSKMKQREYEDYWQTFYAVLRDIENALGKHEYCSELAKHERQVISVYEA
ncbi:hypothetical protein CHS0354_040676 [Potamilus streckersoni]|uniref:DZIP3-like HEPN domain-containing protein n=1 Tax=Potamilus streckersoni TaxID=2493646 RepID=A0AAE0WBS6_9BIVA|nr:hypothetical protein CHS0354_040676 [Potamilus streckersoni]